MLFQSRQRLSLSDIVDALSKGVAHSLSDKWALCKLVHAALLSLTAARHAVLTSSKPPGAAPQGLSGVADSLPYPSDAVFSTNTAFDGPGPVVQLHRVTPYDMCVRVRTGLEGVRACVPEWAQLLVCGLTKDPFSGAELTFVCAPLCP